MSIALDLIGHRFGRLVALEPTDDRYYGSVVWKCNQPKKAMSEEEFLGWIEKVYRHSFKRNTILQNIVFSNMDLDDIYVSE